MKKLLYLIVLLINISSFSQVKDLGGIDYTVLLNKKGNPDFSRSRIWFNYPIKLKKEGSILVNGLKYSNIKLDFDTDYPFDSKPLEEFHVLEYTLGYSALINEKWRYLIQVSPVLSSNLANKISGNDFNFSGGVLFMRTLKEPKESKLTLGLMYSQRVGIPFPLPLIAYAKQVNENIKYTVGIPVNKIKYYFNKKTSSEIFVSLDGYYANLSNNLNVNNQISENISLSGIVAGLGFDKYFGKRLNLYLKSGYTLTNSLRLVRNTRDEVYNFNTAKSFTFRGGLKFNF